MLKLIKLNKNYQDSNVKFDAISGVNLTLPDVGFISILGDCGSGKTTLLNLIGGLDKPTSGEIYFNNENIVNYSDLKLTMYRKNNVGFVFQNFSLISYLNVYQNIKLALDFKSDKYNEKEIILNILKRVNLVDKKNKFPKELSGGEKQRVAIARALINSPSIILADEPTGQLDKKNSHEILGLLKELAKDYLVIMVTHNEEFARIYSDRIITLEDGKIINDVLLNEKINKICKDFNKNDENKKSLKHKTLFGLELFRSLKQKFKLLFISLSFALGLGGLSLSLALNLGANSYIDEIENNTLIKYPISIEDSILSNISLNNYIEVEDGAYPDYNYINVDTSSLIHLNKIDNAYLSYIKQMDSSLYESISYNQKISMNLLTLDNEGVKSFLNTPANFTSQILLNSSYFRPIRNYGSTIKDVDVISGRLPENKNELMLVVDRNNNISSDVLENIGISVNENTIGFDKILNKTYKIINNDDFYEDSNKTSEINGIFLKESYVLKEENLNIYDLYNDLIKLNESYNKEDFENLKELLKRIINYVDVPSGVKVDIDSIDFKDEDQIFNFISSLHQIKETTYFYEPSKEKLEELYFDSNKGEEIKIVGIARPNRDSFISSFSPGVYYLEELDDYLKTFNKIEVSDINQDGVINYLDDRRNKVSKEYEKAFYLNFDGRLNFNVLNIIGNSEISNDYTSYINNRQIFGLDKYVTNILIYPKDYESKTKIRDYLNQYNLSLDEEDKIIFLDLSNDVMLFVKDVINFLSIILISLTSISLLIALIMIFVLTFNSTNERTYEFGVLRSLGAKKTDIGKLVIIDSVFIALLSSMIGLLLSFIVSIFINNSISDYLGLLVMSNIVNIDFINAFIVIAISLVLVILASLIPAYKASNKKPIEALKTIE